MKLTGYFLLIIGVVLFLFTMVYNLLLDVRPVENAGPVNAAQFGGAYWFAMIPSVVAFLVGLWLIMASKKYGNRITYDMTRQQS
jgi:hypothetical protein